MRTSGADQRQENTGDTGRLPALSSASPAPSSSNPTPAANEDRAPTATERKLAVLGPTLRFKGDISAEEDFILQGRVQGSIHHTQMIIIGTGGAVQGTIYARRVVIDGIVEGDLYGVESVVVHETGRVHGNIYAPRVGIVDGAIFNGRIDMTGTAIASQGNHQGTHQSTKQGASPSVVQGANPVAPPTANQASAPTVLKKRVESPALPPGQPMSAEQTERILSPPPKISVVPPPPRREGTGG